MSQHNNPEINKRICAHVPNARLRAMYGHLTHVIESSSSIEHLSYEIELASAINELISARGALISAGIVDVKDYPET